MTLGDIIHEYRKKHGMSMDEFAAKSGIDKAYISVLERNQRPGTGGTIEPSFETIEKLADAMKVDARELVLKVFDSYQDSKNKKTYNIKMVYMPTSNEEDFTCIITGTASPKGKAEFLKDIRTKIQKFTE